MELVDIYNCRHQKTDIVKGRKELSPGEYRLSAFIWIIDDNNNILIQQRTKETKKLPNMWGATAGGVSSGETSLQGIIRETYEEIGLKIKEDELTFIGSKIRINDYIEVWMCKKKCRYQKIKI